MKVKGPKRKEQKKALEVILYQIFGKENVEVEKIYEFMNVPEQLEGEYLEVYNAISKYRGREDFAVLGSKMRVDYAIEKYKLLIEYDERQHFTCQRESSLGYEKSYTLGYDVQKWISACNDTKAVMNKKDDPNRDEQRAFYDYVKDMRALENGYRLIRILHGENDFESEEGREEFISLLPAYIRDEVQQVLFRKYIVKYEYLLELIDRNSELREACKGFSVYDCPDNYLWLKEAIYDDLLMDAYNNGLVLSDYHAELEDNGITDKMLESKRIDDLSDLSPRTLIAVFSYYVRRDHFCEGSFMNDAIPSGIIRLIFELYLMKNN